MLVDAEGYWAVEVEAPSGAGASAEEPMVVPLRPAFVVRGSYVAADGHTSAVDGWLAARGGKRLPEASAPVTPGVTPVGPSSRGGTSFMTGRTGPDGSFVLELEPGAYESQPAEFGRSHVGDPGA